MEISERLLTVWMYKFLLGNLSKEKTEKLKKTILERYSKRQMNSNLERQLVAAFTVNRKSREYLGELLDDWERRLSR